MTEIQAMMSGTVSSVLVKLGDNVSEGQDMIILESMKMNIPIKSMVDGKISKIMVNIGDFVKTNQPLIIIE